MTALSDRQRDRQRGPPGGGGAIKTEPRFLGSCEGKPPSFFSGCSRAQQGGGWYLYVNDGILCTRTMDIFNI